MWVFGLPLDVIRAVLVLVDRGIDELALRRLLVKGKRGPAPKPKPRASPAKREHRKVWTESLYRTLLRFRDYGADSLRRQDRPVTDKAALEEAYRLTLKGCTQRELRWLVDRDRKRLSEARKLVRK